MSGAARPIAFVQVDLDGLWAIRRVYGLPERPEDLRRDPMFELGFSRLLDIFRKRGVRATFFAVGLDCLVEAKADLIRQAAAEGHRVANHSWSHPLGLGALGPDKIDEEIRMAGDAIAALTGLWPSGFRSPGYDASGPVTRALIRRGVLYDASILPTRIGGLMRLAASWMAHRGGAGKRGHYGSGPVWRAPRRPYLPDPDRPWTEARPGSSARLLELPVSVAPGFWRPPIHASVGKLLGEKWLRRQLAGLAREGSAPVNYVFHAIDLVGGGEAPGLPEGALSRHLLCGSLRRKENFVHEALDGLQEAFEVVLAEDFAASFLKDYPK